MSFCSNCADANFLFPLNKRYFYLSEDQFTTHAYFKLSTWKDGDVFECPTCSLVARLYDESRESRKEWSIQSTQSAGRITGLARRIAHGNSLSLALWCPAIDLGFSLESDGDIHEPADFADLGSFDMVIPDTVEIHSYFQRRLIKPVADAKELTEWLNDCKTHHNH